MVRRRHLKEHARRYQANTYHLRANPKHKDTVFRMLFQDKKNLLTNYKMINLHPLLISY